MIRTRFGFTARPWWRERPRHPQEHRLMVFGGSGHRRSAIVIPSRRHPVKWKFPPTRIASTRLVRVASEPPTGVVTPITPRRPTLVAIVFPPTPPNQTKFPHRAVGTRTILVLHGSSRRQHRPLVSSRRNELGRLNRPDVTPRRVTLVATVLPPTPPDPRRYFLTVIFSRPNWQR
jgi:hypothetical protein